MSHGPATNSTAPLLGPIGAAVGTRHPSKAVAMLLLGSRDTSLPGTACRGVLDAPWRHSRSGWTGL